VPFDKLELHRSAIGEAGLQNAIAILPHRRHVPRYLFLVVGPYAVHDEAKVARLRIRGGCRRIELVAPSCVANRHQTLSAAAICKFI
jgi:hypothetical protein